MSYRHQLTKKECLEHIEEMINFMDDLDPYNYHESRIHYSSRLEDIHKYIEALSISADKQVRLDDLESVLVRVRDELNKILGE